MPRNGRTQRYATIVVLLTLHGCAVGPNFKSPKAPATQRYNDIPLPTKTISTPIAKGESQYFEMGKAIPEKWWALFQSESLNQLITKGLCYHPKVEAAQAALRVAKENVNALIGEKMLPAIDTQGSAQRQRFSAQGIGFDDSRNAQFNLFNTQVNVSYTLDIFGGNSRQIEALCALVDYEAFQLEGTYLTLAANIVTTAIAEANLRAQIQTTHTLIALQERILKVTQDQFVLGGASQQNVLSQENLLAQTKAQLPPLNKNLATTRHSLASLVGELPSENELPDFTLDSLKLPHDLPLSLPSQLVRQRPDVRAQEALLHQASANIGVATANLMPQVTLSANFGWQSNLFPSLISPGNNIWSILGNVLQPIFHGGSLLAQRRAAVATFEQMYAEYKDTVLTAFQNVADALRAVEIDAEALQAQTAAEISAKRAFELADKQYKLGAVNYLTLLDSQRQYQEAIINRVQAQAQRLSDTAALFQALGGGWWQGGNTS